ncbi:MAG: glucose-6-phosphate isomerase [Candidatus Omnitrophica bacterium]|nr:glucose-6-phosphate isomerase [Candidatus Omnitrophota bacterium]
MHKGLIYDTRYLEGSVSEEDIQDLFPEIEKAHSQITRGTGEGSDYLGWLDLPGRITDDMTGELLDTASALREKSDVMVIVGIGGSYLGSRAAIECLCPPEEKKRILFAGYNMSCSELKSLAQQLEDKDFSVNVISKSGTTTETAVTFRILQDLLKKKYGPGDISERIIATTDKEKGALMTLARKNGYKTFVIPDDVGGRFSVLTPVGLFPMACAGIDIKELIEGARYQQKASSECDIVSNQSYRYAAVRNCLYRKGKRIEILANFNSRLHYVNEWWRQLFGESEGKQGKGIFPSSCDFSTDLHSMGQLIQQGERNLFETFLIFEKESSGCKVPRTDEDLDKLNYLAGMELSHINRKAYEATSQAHFEGGVPNSTVFLPENTAHSLGQLFYFFEKAVAVSAYLAGVNPFDQPGVEAYKKKMFKLLGKPGA